MCAKGIFHAVVFVGSINIQTIFQGENKHSLTNKKQNNNLPQSKFQHAKTQAEFDSSLIGTSYIRKSKI